MILTAKISTPLIQPGSSDTPMALGIGIAIALLSAALSSLGVNLQALGLSRQRQALQSDENIQTHIPISAHSFDPNNALISTNQFVEPTNGTLLPSPSPVNASDKLFTVVVAGDPRADQQASRPSDEEIETQPLLTPLSSHTISFSPLPPQSFSASGNLSEDSLSEPCSCLSYLRIHWIWYLGFSIYILCEMFGSIFALAYISPVLLAPLGAAGPIFNIIFSRLFLGSLIGIWDIIGTTLIVGGCSIVSIFSSKLPDGGKTLEDLIANFSRPTVAVYFIVQASLLVALFLGIKLLEYSQRIQKLAGYIMSSSSDFETPIVPEEEMLASPLSLAASARSLAGSIAPKQFPQLIGIMYCVLGGAAASETLLLTKAGVTLFISTIADGKNQSQMLIEGTLLGLLILTVFVQLYSLNSALYYQEPVLVVPLFYSVYTILSFVNAIVYLSSIELTSTGDVFILMTGIGLLIAGVWTLRSGRLGH